MGSRSSRLIGHWPEPGISFLPSCVSGSRSMSLRAEWERKREGLDKQVDVNNGTGPFVNKCSKWLFDRRLLEFRELCQ